ncbi:dienelactone hydrolase family protein [Streptomyces sp. NBC_01477]|uniref:dienelactone hydrolase family protein n=1 Tax=Streptomyces sp. NBC_01477 TaxID=2976015 RepID=UPI002E36A40E|nr:dienelactone hydrolase family protein [Streptomyces sp. NBC_01477]
MEAQSRPARPVVSGTVGIPVAGAAGAMAGYVSRPAGGGPWPAVIVGFEMFGLTPYIRGTAERLAGLGLLAVVPDFYHRTAPGFSGTADEQGRARGYALLNRLTREEVRADLLATLAHLEQREDTSGRPGMVGFSLGGHLAFYAASQVPLSVAAVVYPGWLDVAGTALSTPDPLLDLAQGIAEQGCRVLYLVGADDHVVTADQTRLTAQRLTAAGVPHEVVVYPGTPHGFLADGRDTYRSGAARDAWRRLALALTPR